MDGTNGTKLDERKIRVCDLRRRRDAIEDGIRRAQADVANIGAIIFAEEYAIEEMERAAEAAKAAKAEAAKAEADAKKGKPG